MNNNRKIIIATGQNRKSINWTNSEMLWSEFVEKLKTPQRTQESFESFMKLKKAQQDELKDVGGFVGGAITGHRRKNSAITSRDLITLDLDNINTGLTKEVIKKVNSLGCAYAIYSTRKHAEFAPRLRVIVPTDRSVSPDEYEPIARKLASLIGIQMADPTTFEVARLMYWPSCSRDSDYVFDYSDNPFLSADGILNTYDNWRDISSWPQVPGHEVARQRELARQQDPLTKRGVIGAFCRTYTVPEAMEKFIPKAYEPTDKEDRFTYVGGSTSGGAIVYDDKFLYSHHATDPCSGELVNAFDLIRLHLFGEQDTESKEDTPVNKLPSYMSMSKLAIQDGGVATILNSERHEKALEAFRDSLGDVNQAVEEDDLSWMSKLEKDLNNGQIKKTINNIVLILENIKDIKGKIALDEFANRGMVLGSLPWNNSDDKRLWTDIDDAELARFLEVGFGITGSEKIDKALLIASNRNKFNDVKRYIESQKWDGKKRIDTLLHDYLGVEQNVYTADVMRKSLTAAVARAITGEAKFDYMPIFTGAQGIGKSTFLAKLGGEWFSDSLTNFEGKEAAEMIQGTWINELAELAGFNRSETNAIKQFITKQHDVYREAYGKRTNKYPRRCVFFGTTNDDNFLKDTTGNRRFWPVDCGVEEPKKSIFDDLDSEIGQIWAEAKMLYMLGEPLYLSGESDRLAKEAQEMHQEDNAKKGIIEEFLEIKIPVNWYDLSLSIRKQYLQGNANIEGIRLVERDKITAIEVWAECFGKPKEYLTKKDASEINSVLESLKGWQRYKGTRSLGKEYGKQRGFEKIKSKIDIKNNIIELRNRA